MRWLFLDWFLFLLFSFLCFFPIFLHLFVHLFRCQWRVPFLFFFSFIWSRFNPILSHLSVHLAFKLIFVFWDRIFTDKTTSSERSTNSIVISWSWAPLSSYPWTSRNSRSTNLSRTFSRCKSSSTISIGSKSPSYSGFTFFKCHVI